MNYALETVRTKSIVFSRDMVEAILAGKKCQTRRAVKPQPARLGKYGEPLSLINGRWLPLMPADCFFGQVGDLLSIRCPADIRNVDITEVFLRITHVSLQRLHDVDASEAEMELGFHLYSLGNEALYRFKKYWEKTYGSDSWHQNPWVWAIEFELVR